jgi:hypothetical protein
MDRRSRRRWVKVMNRQIGGLTWALVLMVGSTALTGCTAAMSSSGAPVPGGSASESIAPGPSIVAKPSSSKDAPGLIGFSGGLGWMLSHAGISLSADGGRAWSPLALPEGMAPSSITAISQSPNRPLWVAAVDAAGLHLYSRSAPGAAWDSQLLVPDWPKGSPIGPPDRVLIAPGPGNLLAVTASIDDGTTGALSSLFVSSDDGKTFVQHPATFGAVDVAWQYVAFVTPQAGLVVGGPSMEAMFHTSDGAKTWTLISKGLPAVGTFSLGQPLITGSDIKIPVNDLGPDGTATEATFSLLVSHDGGASFTPSGPPLSVGAIPQATDSRGDITWVTTNLGGEVFESADGGKTWTVVAAPSLPSGVTSISLTSPTAATAVVAIGGCTGFKTGCWSQNELLATTDGGRTWTAL